VVPSRPIQLPCLAVRVQRFADLLFFENRSGTPVPERFAYPLASRPRSGYNLQPEPLGAALWADPALGGFLEIQAV